MSIALATPTARLTVLALEPDPVKAHTIAQAVSAIRRTSLTVVESKDRLLETLRDGLPDLVLLPAFLPWADEAQLSDALRSASETHCFEVLVTPYEIVQSAADCEAAADAPAGWRRLLKRPPPRPKSIGCSIRTFRERVEWALECAQQARLERAEQFQLYDGMAIGQRQDRRSHRRFAGSELPWLQMAGLRDGARVRLVDLSAGGALVQSDTRLSRDAEGLLELNGTDRNSAVPFRVVRWQRSSGDQEFPYLGAISFMGVFDFDNLAGPPSVAVSFPPESVVLAPFLRSAESRQERDQRFTREQVPWLSSVRLPWGAEVQLVNISKSGMLVETASKLSPGSLADFSICGPDTDQTVPARVIRSEIGVVNSLGVKYHAAVTFTGSVPFRLETDPSQPGRMLVGLLNDVLNRAGRSEEGTRALRQTFTDGVRKLVRAREVAIAHSPMRSEAGAESIYFTVPGTSGSAAVLQATFEPDHVPTEAEFRCLQSAAALTTAVLEFERL